MPGMREISVHRVLPIPAHQILFPPHVPHVGLEMATILGPWWKWERNCAVMHRLPVPDTVCTPPTCVAEGRNVVCEGTALLSARATIPHPVLGDGHRVVAEREQGALCGKLGDAADSQILVVDPAILDSGRQLDLNLLDNIEHSRIAGVVSEG